MWDNHKNIWIKDVSDIEGNMNKQYLLWYDRVKDMDNHPEDFIVLQCRGEFPYAYIRLGMAEVVELIIDLQKMVEDLQPMCKI
mgnify:CR=1 FL=1